MDGSCRVVWSYISLGGDALWHDSEEGLFVKAGGVVAVVAVVLFHVVAVVLVVVDVVLSCVSGIGCEM